MGSQIKKSSGIVEGFSHGQLNNGKIVIIRNVMKIKYRYWFSESNKD